MKILWIIHSASPLPGGDPRLLKSSQLAGYRMRVGIPASSMPASDQQFLLSTTTPDVLQRAAAVAPDVCVFSKVLPSTPDAEAARLAESLARGLSGIGVPMALDIADNYFEDFRREDTLRLLRLSTAVVANTVAMADVIEELAQRRAQIIGDPVEGERLPAQFDPPPGGLLARLLCRPPRPLRLLWFGGQWRTYEAMRMLYPHLVMPGKAVEVCVMTSQVAEIEQDVADHHSRFAPALALKFVPWSRAAVVDALSACDLVVIPDEVTHPKRIGASTNRLTESLWAGRFVVANGVPSYWEFKDSAWIGADIPAGIRWATAHPAQVRARIAAGQARIQSHYVPREIGHRWRAFLAGLAGV
jgi:hypothetical protein